MKGNGGQYQAPSRYQLMQNISNPTNDPPATQWDQSKAIGNEQKAAMRTWKRALSQLNTPLQEGVQN